MAALDWLNDIIRALLLFVPRVRVVRATHGGVKWRYGRKVLALRPGLCIYWPLVSEIEIIPTARQTTNLVEQTVETSDRQTVVVSAIVVHEVKDVLLAIGQRNYDLSDTVCDMALGAIAEIVNLTPYNDLRVRDLNARITRATKAALRSFGVAVDVVKVTDLALARTFRVIS